ncbi:hypothetical protein [Oryza sativa Japonica Group]|uniref:Uncharacterized protein n=2 Tax=Oryza sativa subsp. japonica TaxID=39947 RepID=Q5QMM1_ORYSJ|nr:hypothetical protein [Oryza sativa Japonica Group]BAD73557.1 hypothetical protein [Oryza sativa Japonica Group]
MPVQLSHSSPNPIRTPLPFLLDRGSYSDEGEGEVEAKLWVRWVVKIASRTSEDRVFTRIGPRARVKEGSEEESRVGKESAAVQPSATAFASCGRTESGDLLL